MAPSKHPLDGSTSDMPVSEKKRIRRTGKTPQLDPKYDINSLDPALLDECVQNITAEEHKMALACCVWPQRHEPFAISQFKFLKSLIPEFSDLHEYRTTYADARPHIERSRLVAKFYTDLSKSLPMTVDPTLRDAVSYRQAYWITCYVFERSPPMTTKEFKELTDEKQEVFYARIVEGACRHRDTEFAMKALESVEVDTD